MDILKKVCKEETFTLHPVTPIMTHRDKVCEFRYPALKGMMRFWWRSVNYFEDFREMYDEETVLFGGAAKKSPLVFQPVKNVNEISKGQLGSRKNSVSMIQDDEVKFIMRYQGIEAKSWDKYLALLKLSSYLGGLGQKSRKGYGAFQVEDVCNISSQEELREKIVDCLSIVSNRSWLKKSENVICLACEHDPIKKYAGLEKVYIGPKVKTDLFLKNAFKSPRKALDQKRIFKDKVGESEPVMIVSCYPSSEDREVYPVLCRFNLVLKKNENTEEISRAYSKYCKIYINQFQELEKQITGSEK